jgi:hypothetical protein
MAEAITYGESRKLTQSTETIYQGLRTNSILLETKLTFNSSASVSLKIA